MRSLRRGSVARGAGVVAGPRVRRRGTRRDLAESCPVTGDLPLLGFGLPVSGAGRPPDTMRRTRPSRRGARVRVAVDLPARALPLDGELGPLYRAVHDPVVPSRTSPGTPIGSGWGRRPSARRSRARAAREDPDVAGRAVRRPAHCRARDRLAAAGVRRRRRTLRAAGRADGRVPALPGGAVDAGPRRVSRRVLHGAALAHGPAARAATAPPSAARRRGCARHCVAPDGSPRAGSAAAGRTSPGSARASRWCATAPRSWARPRGRRIVVRGVVDLDSTTTRRQRRPLQGTREQVLDDLAALRARGVTEVFFDFNFSSSSRLPRRRRRRGTPRTRPAFVAFAPANGWSSA